MATMATTATAATGGSRDDSAQRTALLTGGTGTIGKQIAVKLAAAGLQVVLAVRDAARGEALVKEVVQETGNKAVRMELVDLDSQKSILELAERLAKAQPELHVLVNDAAVVPDSRKTTKDGLELQFAVNVHAYYLLMTKLRPLLAAGAAGNKLKSRIVNVASDLAGQLDLSDLQWERRDYEANSVYQQCKQCNRMMSKAAADKFAADGITVNACHPGVVTSTLLKDLGYNSGWDSADAGATTPAFLALDPSIEGVTGKYWSSCKAKKCKFMDNTKQVAALWAAMEELEKKR